MGGSDQWEILLPNRANQAQRTSEAFAITTPLITKADGTKFGKSEGGTFG